MTLIVSFYSYISIIVVAGSIIPITVKFVMDSPGKRISYCSFPLHVNNIKKTGIVDQNLTTDDQVPNSVNRSKILVLRQAYNAQNNDTSIA